jgi:ATP-dependent protease ClpP protease subunit
VSQPQPRQDAVPTYRYWGARKPPKQRAEMFSVAPPTQAVVLAEGGPTAAAQGATVGTIRMYGPIDSWGGWWGICAEDVSEALDLLGPVDQIVLRVNCPGGEVWEALTILNMLRAHPASITAVVDGLCASAASFVVASCDERVMSPGTQLMVHDASGFAFGTPADIAKTVAMLETSCNSSAQLFADAAGGTAAEWRAAQVAETWYTAQEAVAAGLADRVDVVPDAGPSTTVDPDDEPGSDDGADVEDDDPMALVAQRFDLSIYAYAGRSHAPAPRPVASLRTGHQPPSASAVGSVTTQEGSSTVAFSPEQLTSMRQDLGLAADADEATIVAALSEVVAEQAEDRPSPSDTPTQRASVPPGMSLIETDVLTQLQAGASAGQAARDQQQAEHRERVLTQALREGRITPARREHWATQLAADPEGVEQLITSLPAVVPTAEHGHADGPEVEPGSSLDEIRKSPAYQKWSM